MGVCHVLTQHKTPTRMILVSYIFQFRLETVGRGQFYAAIVCVFVCLFVCLIYLYSDLYVCVHACMCVCMHACMPPPLSACCTRWAGTTFRQTLPRSNNMRTFVVNIVKLCPISDDRPTSSSPGTQLVPGRVRGILVEILLLIWDAGPFLDAAVAIFLDNINWLV